MEKFCKKHNAKILGTISIFDRLIFKGYLPINDCQSMTAFVDRQGWLRKDMPKINKGY